MELLISLGIFIVISGAAFGLLDMAQKRFQTDGQILSSFQQGRLALDQIVRDVNDAGEQHNDRDHHFNEGEAALSSPELDLFPHVYSC